MRVLFIEPDKKPVVKDIPNELRDLQEAVGGYIETLSIFNDNVTIIINEEGKLNELPENRVLNFRDGVEPLVGNILIVGVNLDDFADLTDEQIERYSVVFTDKDVYV